MTVRKIPQLILLGLLAASFGASAFLKPAHADDSAPKPAAQAEADKASDDKAGDEESGGGDEGRGNRNGGGGYSSPNRSYSPPPSYSQPSRSNSQPSRSNSQPSRSQPVNVGGGFTARTNPNGGIQYRNESTGRDVSRREFESQRGVTGRVNPNNGGIQFRDNNTGRDVSHRDLGQSSPRRDSPRQDPPRQDPPRQDSRRQDSRPNSSKPVDVGGGFTARTNPNGGIQYRDERTGRDVSRKDFERQRGVTGRVNPDNGGIQFRDNNTGRDVSQKNVRRTYGGRPISDYRPTTVGGRNWDNYRSTTINNYHIDNSVNYHSYRSGYGYGYYNGGSWYGYHPLFVNNGWGYYDIYGTWSPIVDATYLALLAADIALATRPLQGVTYVQTGDGINIAQSGTVVYDAPFDETKVVEETVTDPDGNTVKKIETTRTVW